MWGYLCIVVSLSFMCVRAVWFDSTRRFLYMKALDDFKRKEIDVALRCAQSFEFLLSRDVATHEATHEALDALAEHFHSIAFLGHPIGLKVEFDDVAGQRFDRWRLNRARLLVSLQSLETLLDTEEVAAESLAALATDIERWIECIKSDEL